MLWLKSEKKRMNNIIEKFLFRKASFYLLYEAKWKLCNISVYMYMHIYFYIIEFPLILFYKVDKNLIF